MLAGSKDVFSTGGRKLSTLECFLEGALNADRYGTLINRLLGLCGPSGRGSLPVSSWGIEESIPLTLHYHEFLFQAPPPVVPSQASQPQTVGAATAASLGLPANPPAALNDLRVRCRLVPLKEGGVAPAPSAAWSVHYFGVPKMQEKLVSNVRNVIGAEVSDNIIEFLRLMGYHFQFEFIREGVIFQTQRKITISVTQIKKILDRDDLSTAEPVVAGVWFVELSARTDDSNMVPSLTEEINNFADYLSPLVELKRVDYRRFFASSSTFAEVPKQVCHYHGIVCCYF